ncbi:hypothetical protein [Janthinobacterium sp. J1-1]|uniref:hypothetical protein n=1 Tax=Janthinobacterium sp. J1-1 TaxID=3065910 RepID=UPI002810A0F8|nr:hypothetical protein [Janthinobacterium sp. J1-1]
MKTLKNLEAIFTVAVAIACSASYVSFLQAPAAKADAAQSTTAMQVVTVTAKRLTPQEKQLSLLEERQSRAESQQGSSTASLL